jgi:hypothetical protein
LPGETGIGNYIMIDKIYTKNFHKKVNNRFFELYGNKCACCGEMNRLFLTLDHINDNGREELKTLGNQQIRQKAIKDYRPDIYQVLCYNCNCGRAKNGGICPHKGKPT